MRIDVVISPKEATSKEFAKVSLSTPDGTSTELDLDFTTLLRRIRKPSSAALDFLFFAAVVYGIDKLVPRKTGQDHWTRHLEVSIPVEESHKWTPLCPVINDCVGFLTGDEWSVSFSPREHSIIRPRRRQRRTKRIPMIRGNAACLFSGGLDSLVGAIDWLEFHPDKSLVAVGHHDPSVAGPLSDQKRVRTPLQQHYSTRLSSILVGVGQYPSGPEITFRSRSLLFIGLGLCVASSLGEGTPLLIPENGTIAVNVELTPSRRGSCSTRTAHPYYLSRLQDTFDGLGLVHPLSNPLLPKTKGEVVEQCQNPTLVQQAALGTVSCAKRGHKRTWKNRQAKGCGRCMPCIYRRAALHRIDLDREEYGVDICQGDVDVGDSGSEAADDFRACLSFLNRNPTQNEIARMLVSNGPLSPNEALAHAATVNRAMDEIRALLKAKGTPGIKRLAGLMWRPQS
jgi:hypothetical protein